MQSSSVTASSQTQAAEQLLLQTQVKMQATTRTLKQANEMADNVLNKCRDILTIDYLPEMAFPE